MIWRTLALLTLATTLFLMGCTQPTVTRCSDCHVFLISIDTLRADHLGCYGYNRPTSPHIDAFRKDAVLFEWAISHAPSTTPSHAAIFTGLIPSSHGAFYVRRSGIRADVQTLPEVLKARGFETASFNGGAQLHSDFGFSRGFDIYSSYPTNDYEHERFADRVAGALQWLNEKPRAQSFVFLHSYDIHSPYAPDPKHLSIFSEHYSGPVPAIVTARFLHKINIGRQRINAADRQRIIDSYDAEIRGVDEAFARFIAELKRLGIYDKSIIIVTSDHGEEFGEHGKIGWHSHTLYDELLHVPLIVKLPQQQFANRSIAQQVRGIDILPTILDLLNAPALPTIEGQSLVRLMQHGVDPSLGAHAISQKDVGRPKAPSSARTERWKLYRHKLYDLKQDPHETTDTSSTHPTAKSELEDVVRQWTAPKAPTNSKPVEIDTETLEQLESLGYAG